MPAASRRALAVALVASSLSAASAAHAQASFESTTILGAAPDLAHVARLQFDVTQAGNFRLYTRGPQVDANMYLFYGAIASLPTATLRAGRFDDECPTALCGPAGSAANSLAELFLDAGTYTLVGGTHFLDESEAKTGNADVVIAGQSATASLTLVVDSQDGRATPLNASSTVPEPGTWALLGTGLLGLAGVARRRRPA